MVYQERAYAKINLGLKIVGKRKDGYHNILSLLQTVDLHDRLIFRDAREGIQIRCAVPGVPRDHRNLVYQAVETLRAELSVDRGVVVDIDKRIPVGAGLGGGSSDAAATIRALNRLWKLDIPFEGQVRMAAQLGSDVPFFLKAGTAVASGRGEVLKYVRWEEEIFYVLVYPGFPVSTAWAYGQLGKIDLTKGVRYINFINSLAHKISQSAELLACLESDFEALIEGTYPAVSEIKERLRQGGAVACSLSGSGSTMYGVFQTRAEAERALASLQDTSWTAFVCRPWEVQRSDE